MFTRCISVALTRKIRFRQCTFENAFQLKKFYSVKVLESPFGDVNIPDKTLSDLIWSQCKQWKNLPAVTCGASGRSYTFGQGEMLSKQGAMALVKMTNLKARDRIGFLLPNIPEYLIAVHASLQAGLAITFANPLYTANELTRQFGNADVRCIVTIPQLLDTAKTVAKELKQYDCTIVIGGKTDLNEKIFAFDAVLSKPCQAELPTVNTSDTAVVPYSSGTTGMPKGVELTHKNLVANIVQCAHPVFLNYQVPSESFQDTVLTVLPFFHIYGFNVVLNYINYLGIHIVTLPKFTVKDFIDCLEKYQPTILFVVPSLLLFLATHPQVTTKHLTSINRIYSGAAPMKENLFEMLKQKMGHDCSFYQGYGMSETSPGITLSPSKMPFSKIGSCGQLIPMTKARIIGLSDGKDINAPNEVGELLVKGPQVMKGYLNDPVSTNEIIDVEGWLHTGDVVYYDEDEYFYVVDRTKELIKVKGNQVSPTELESLILEIPEVVDVAVVGVPDDFAGEVPKAYIVKKSGSEMTSEVVLNFVSTKVVPYKQLAGGVSFVKEIPRNPSGKIMRNELKMKSYS